MHWFSLAKHNILLHQCGEQFKRGAFVGLVKRAIWMFIIRERQQTFHAISLHLNELHGVAGTSRTNSNAPLIGWQRVKLLHLSLFGKFSQHSVLNWKSVAIPTWRVWTTHALHQTASNHHVLENLVHHMANMDWSIGVRRSIMKSEDGRVGSRGIHALIKIHLSESLQRLGFGLRQIRLHGEVGCGQLKRVAIFRHWRRDDRGVARRWWTIF